MTISTAASRIPTHEEAPRVRMLMRSGRWVHLYDPMPADIVISDWVYGASRVNRWGGQTRGECGFNDLAHHLLVQRILVELVWPQAPAEARLWALCHDLHEGGGLGDICTPYGRLFQPQLRELKDRLDRAIKIAIGLPATLSPRIEAEVKRADIIAAVSEAVQLMGWPEALARRDIGKGYRGRLWPLPIEPVGEAYARHEWWQRYRLLGGLE